MRRRLLGGRDRGAAGLFVAVLAPFLIGLAGLVFDGGLALEARQRALDAAEQAARAGANQCDEELLRDNQGCVMTGRMRGRVNSAVSTYMRDGVQLERLDVTDGGRTVVVKTRISVDTIFLGLFGVDRFDLEVPERSATAVTGLA
jgi:hypothetical protein